ncbi:uncharacterized protein LOC129569023 isoform X2 [Sitodiplosis mosellana]|uniref:uncharacterized protein LOC129569023 isoform X2 n=1 Tax=Sitodiplosis mosellana TaxID=263140 RepID=UPI00244489F7|nr:uncharacterized protein LOC129569023 isoform X2 [Sitodiplosis mosellana]
MANEEMEEIQRLRNEMQNLHDNIMVAQFDLDRAMDAKRKRLELLEKELEEIDRQFAAEQAKTDAIEKENQQIFESYESNFRELEIEIANDEAEIQQILAELGEDTAPVAETSEEQPIVQPSTTAATEQLTAEIPLHLQKMEVVENLPEIMDDSFEESSPNIDQLLAIANSSGPNETSSSSPTEADSQNVSNHAPNEPTDQDDPSYARPEHSQHSDESNVVEATNAPTFVTPLAPVPHKRKESGPEQVSPAKKAHYESNRSQFASRASSREPPRKSPHELLQEQRESPRKSARQLPQNEIGSTERNRSGRIEPVLSLVKIEYPTEQKRMITQPTAQSQSGVTPREVLSELYVQHRENERSRHSNQSSAFAPIQTHARHQTTDNRSGSFSVSSGQSASKAPAKFSSAKATATTVASAPPSVEGTLRIHTHRRNEQPGMSRSGQRDHNYRTGRSDEQFRGIGDDKSFSSMDFPPQQSSMFSTAKETTVNPATASAVESTSKKRTHDGNETTHKPNEQTDSSRSARHGVNELSHRSRSDTDDDMSTFGNNIDFDEFSFDAGFDPANSAREQRGESSSFDGDASFIGDLSFSENRSGTGAGEFNLDELADFGFDD